MPFGDRLVSIVTITLNSEAFLKETIESVLNQTYTNFEYLIVDGGSTDRTLEIANSYSDPRIKIHVGKDKGISDAMNRGIQLTKGEIIGLIHSDDAYQWDAIEKTVEAFEKSPHAGWSYGLIDYFSRDGKILYRAGGPFDLRKMKKFMLPPHPSVFVKKSTYERVGLFSLEYRLAMDYDLCLRLALDSTPAFVNAPLAKMRLGGESSKSFQAELRAADEVYLIKSRLLKPEEVKKAWVYHKWMRSKVKLRALLSSSSLLQKLIPIGRKFLNPAYRSS